MSHKPRTTLEVQCGRCRHVYRATSEEVRAGTWRNCPKCRAPCDYEDDEPGDERRDGDS